MRAPLSGGPVGVLCSVVVCVCHEPDLERVQPVQAASAAGSTGAAGRAARSVAQRCTRAATTTGGEAAPRSARETTAFILETTSEYQGLRRLRMSSRWGSACIWHCLIYDVVGIQTLWLQIGHCIYLKKWYVPNLYQARRWCL